MHGCPCHDVNRVAMVARAMSCRRICERLIARQERYREWICVYAMRYLYVLFRRDWIVNWEEEEEEDEIDHQKNSVR